jgi:hypothetical protein
MPGSYCSISDHQLDHRLRQGCKSLPKIWEHFKILGIITFDTKSFPYWGPTNSSRHLTQFSFSDDPAPMICASLDKGTFYTEQKCIYTVWHTYLMLYNSLRTLNHGTVISRDVAICWAEQPAPRCTIFIYGNVVFCLKLQLIRSGCN